jgi:hypothetical protein
MIAPHIIERARAIRIEDEIAKRGIRLKGRIDRSGPCPVCGGTDRFAIHVRKQKWLCRGCGKGGGDAISLVQFIDGIAFAEAVELLAGEEARPEKRPLATAKKQSLAEYEREHHRKAAWLWSQHQAVNGTIAEPYLREVRKYCRPLPATLGFLPPLKAEHHPAMIAAFALVGEAEPGVLAEPAKVEAVHLTMLVPGWDQAETKLPKIIIGSPLGLPIILAPPNDLLGLAITEGIGDGLSVYEATGLGVWAAGSAPFMPKLAATVPDYIECVTIFAHNDQNGAGQDGAYPLAQALHERGIEVLIEGLPCQ